MAPAGMAAVMEIVSGMASVDPCNNSVEDMLNGTTQSFIMYLNVPPFRAVRLSKIAGVSGMKIRFPRSRE